MRLARLIKQADTRAASLLRCSAALCVAGIIAGCDTKGFIDPAQTVRGGHPSEPLVVPILNELDPADEGGNTEFVNAVMPTKADLVTSNNDYLLSANDQLQISISDLMGPGVETTRVARVTESGNISLPFLGTFHAAGLSQIELEQEIVKAYQKAALVANAQVSVTIIESRGRTVEILGAVNGPGQYAILDSDFRLLNALVLARDVNYPTLDYIYVIRRSEAHRPAAPAQPEPMGNPDQGPNVTPGSGGAGRPPASGPAPDDLAPHTEIQRQDGGLARNVSANRPLSLVMQAAASPDDLAPGATTTAPSASQLAGPATQSGSPAPAAPTPPAAAAPNTTSQPFEFNAPPTPGTVRVIRIPYQALRNGDMNYNIAIHPHDLVIVQQPAIGNYYMGGHVARPGVFTLTGQKITLKEAVISAGMFDELAIPQRTDIVRRLKPDREVFVRVDLDRIFAGQQPDVFLKPDDQVMVGTNAFAPFLAALRGSFRITYGFGFLYDKNYAYSGNTLGF